MREVIFSSNAYCKIIMHCAKYPHCAVNGILLAAKEDGDDKDKPIAYIDAIPMFHICLHLSPMAEVALTQIELWAESAGLKIAGYYLANENLNDLSYEKPAHRIADKINEKNRSSALVVVDNRLVTLNHSIPAVKSLFNVDGKWKQQDKYKVTVEDSVLEQTSVLLRRKTYYDLVDFDNHLDNISLDWKNTQLNQQIKNLTNNTKKKS